MTIVTVVVFPIVLLYQGWSFYVFRARVRGPAPANDVDAAAAGPAAQGQPG
jgi:cytochrome d ubiquinol oxidase subunit II